MWLASDLCHPQVRRMCCRVPPSEPSAVPLPPPAHHWRLAGRYCRLLRRTWFPRPATPLSYHGFHSQPHSWWWNFNSPKKPTCVTVTLLDQGPCVSVSPGLTRLALHMQPLPRSAVVLRACSRLGFSPYKHILQKDKADYPSLGISLAIPFSCPSKVADFR